MSSLKKVLKKLDEVTKELNTLDIVSVTDPGIVMQMKEKCSNLIKEAGNDDRRIIENGRKI